MMAQLTMEAITATLNPKVSYFDMAAANQTQKHISEVSTFIPLFRIFIKPCWNLPASHFC